MRDRYSVCSLNLHPSNIVCTCSATVLCSDEYSVTSNRPNFRAVHLFISTRDNTGCPVLNCTRSRAHMVWEIKGSRDYSLKQGRSVSCRVKYVLGAASEIHRSHKITSKFFIAAEPRGINPSAGDGSVARARARCAHCIDVQCAFWRAHAS